MNFIPPFDLNEQFKLIGEEVSAAALAILASGRYIGGASVEQFEQQFAQYIGTSSCVGCNSGTDALFLALRSLDIGAGDEVITSPFTFISTAGVISAVGAKPVFTDIDAQTFNLDLDQIEAAITPRTKAIIPVHLFGQPIDMTRLMAIAHSHNLWVIEDCAQSTGATWQGTKLGSIGHIGCFSFYPTKNLGACGDGGAATTNDAAIAAKLRMLRDHGQRQRYTCEAIGVNSRLDALQAAILSIKLRHLDDWNAQRQAIADRYCQMLQPLPGVVTPQAITGGVSVWNQYTIRVLPNASEQGSGLRDRVRQQLQQQGVGSMVYYPYPLHLQPVYADLGYASGDLPVSEQMAQQVLSLPMFPELSAMQQEQVVHTLKDCLV
ncbi:MAG: DegT/DnrJ/EryC1/StrS family aminotransferase [Oscillatoriophycideae cyanobacterium NC_groundwater_1537_Pr4_S-0.65um_50_18]|nr:DegT/DnrJ/EryC1/StrS family aminotransferase [Oscillatoriophycideae cyanobacterium NC_groundwater_1537_Pr4_S-0.65um_50_18]